MSPEDWERLGIGLREWRESQGMSRFDLAARAGVSYATIQKLEMSRAPYAKGCSRAMLAKIDRVIRPVEAGVIPNEKPTTIAGQIRWYRERKGMSKQELARKTRLSPATISKLESPVNNGSPSLPTLRRVATALGLELFAELREERR